MEQSREPGGPGWCDRGRGAWPARGTRLPGRGTRVGASDHGVADVGLRRCRAPHGAGESKAAGDSVAHRAAEPAEEARTNPLVGLGRRVGRSECGYHGGEITMTNGWLSIWKTGAVRKFFWGRGLAVLPGAPVGCGGGRVRWRQALGAEGWTVRLRAVPKTRTFVFRDCRVGFVREQAPSYSVFAGRVSGGGVCLGVLAVRCAARCMVNRNTVVRKKFRIGGRPQKRKSCLILDASHWAAILRGKRPQSSARTFFAVHEFLLVLKHKSRLMQVVNSVTLPVKFLLCSRSDSRSAIHLPAFYGPVMPTDAATW